MPSPTISQVHIDRPLTNMTVAFLQAREAYLAASVFPTIPSPNKSDLYFEFPRQYWLANRTHKRAAGTQAARTGYKLITTQYNCERDAIGHQIPDPIRANADNPLDLDMAGTQFVAQQLMLALEIDWVAKFFAASIWTGSSTGADLTASPTWDDAASTPIEDIRTQKRAVLQSTGFEPNCLVLGKSTFDRLCDHPDIVDRIKYGQTAGGPATANEETLAKLLGLDKIVVARAVQNTGTEEAAASYSFIAGTTKALLVYAAPNPGLMVPSGGYRFTWGGTGNGQGVEVKRYRDEPLESDVIEGGIWYSHKLVSAALGAFWGTAVAS
jgi:Phage major capsid protein E